MTYNQPIAISSLCFSLLFSTGLLLLSCTGPAEEQANAVQNDSDAQIQSVQSAHIIIDQLGAQHLANLVYRNSKDGPKLVGWGRKPMTEWTLGAEPSSSRQVVAANADQRYSNGGCAMDVDDDGEDEIIVARGAMSNLSNASLMWFDPVDEQKFWEEHTIASIWEGGFTAPHDIQPYDFENAEGEEIKAILANKSRRELYIFVVPDDPRQEWDSRLIGEFPVADQSGLEIIDINQDGREDIVSGIYWLEAPADPMKGEWIFHQYGTWDTEGRRWGGMNQHGIADFDGDGSLEIVVSEAEIPDARLSLFDPKSGNIQQPWQETPLDSGLYAPHSLVVMDVNQDKLPDLLVGEMTAGGWDFPMNPNPKIYAYINQGEYRFEKQVFSEGWGVHEMKIAPLREDGKMMIYAADEIQPQKFKAMNTHISYWTIDTSGS
jgi:hypothetical protein